MPTYRTYTQFTKVSLDSDDQKGKTGSITATLQNDPQKYQVKRSVLNNPISLRTVKLRLMRAFYNNPDSVLDTENFREIIAAKIVKAVVADDRKHLVPDIEFITDNSNSKAPNRIGITSKWLQPTDNDKASTRTEKQERAQCLAEFMLVANHDCNDGNFIKVEKRFGAIDYGKAFNALLNAPEKFGGQVRNTNNQILDYLNREMIPSGKNTTPKLWQFNADLVPSKELADAMAAMAAGAKENIAKGIIDAKQEFTALLNTPSIDKRHVLESLAEVANNLARPKISINLQNPEETISYAFSRIENFAINQVLAMEKTAQLMHAQVELDEKLKNPNFKAEDLVKWRDRHHSVVGIDVNSKITWIKASKDTPAVEGTVRDYIKASAKRLGIDEPTLNNNILSNTDLLPRTGLISRIRSGSFSSRSSSSERSSSTTSRDSLSLSKEEAVSLRKSLEDMKKNSPLTAERSITSSSLAHKRPYDRNETL